MNQQDPIAADAVNELTSVLTEMSVEEISIEEVAEQESLDNAAEAEPITAETDAAPAP